eukprot:TRINITY_DN4177_c0_g1_i2.p1 TRINITY_DN4177_c0_g1~~TRINITY_DN4177_c0_g1_i2.p1  ORF type:complete len:613 (+),score=-6.80 TRINITY_DN4177_c0_g1_i2:504-2342(+)
MALQVAPFLASVASIAGDCLRGFPLEAALRAYQYQSCFILLVLTGCWLWASQSRVRESRRIRRAQRAGHPLAFVDPDLPRLSHGAQRQLPMVSMVLAVKGSVGEAGMDNWRSQLVTLYGGEMEYIFSVESEVDPAFHAVRCLQREMKGVATVRLVVAGLATNCSQQIHNQLAAAKVACPRSKYLLLLDDDIQCHPGTIGALVRAMESKNNVFCCSGYSFDIPSSPSLSAYAAMAFRLPLQIGMATGGRGFVAWGGCIMIRLDDLRQDRYGLWSALQRNGYSNDLILTSIAGNNGCTLWCPPTAIFPGRMSGDWTFRRYWNYARRQTFALTTYCSPFSFRVNAIGFVWYSYSALVVMVGLLPSAAYLLSFLAASLNALLPAALAAGPLPGSFCRPALLAASATWLCVVLSVLSGVRLFHAVVTLCNLLSPEKSPIRLGSISIVYGIAGMFLNLALVPVISIYTLLQPSISWAGITYVRRRGLIHKVFHPTTGAVDARASAVVAPTPTSPVQGEGAAKRAFGENVPSATAAVSPGGAAASADVQAVESLSLRELQERYWDMKPARQPSSDWELLMATMEPGSSWSKAWAVRVEVLCRRIPIIGRSLSPRKKRTS